ncbi:MAG: hypothetical protein KF901_04475 [Myxococcales bacterium]|nr:hypothetical protein [Myxococcales bacterium]
MDPRLRNVWLGSLMIALLACGDDDAPGEDAGARDAEVPVDAPDDAGDEPDAGFDAGPPPPPCAPALELYADHGCDALRAGIDPYAPRFWLWSDGTDKERFIHLPAVIDTRDPDAWVFPVGTKVWKTFSLDGRRLETRIMEKVRAGMGVASWTFRTFRWNEGQDDVTEVENGERDVLGTTHDIPSQAACVRCHAPAGGGSPDILLGFGTVQLAHEDAGLTLAALAAAGRLSDPVTDAMGAVPGDEVAVAALGYLHANCGHCHGDSGAAPAGLSLWLRGAHPDLEATGVFRTAIGVTSNWRDPTRPEQTLFRVLAGRPEDSTLFIRTGLRDEGAGQMPPLATEQVHEAGRDALRVWIESLD